VTYARDAAGRVSAVTSQLPGASGLPLATAVGYQPFGPMANWTSGNGVTNTRTFDLDYRVTDIVIAGTAVLHDLAYGYDVVDNVTNIADNIDPAQSQTFDYDLRDRLAVATGAYGAQTYTYDANGNRTRRDTEIATSPPVTETQTLSYVAGTNQLGLHDGQHVQHDDAGHRTSDAGGARVYGYNNAGRLSQFSENGILKASYRYNTAGQRARKVRHLGEADQVRHYFYDLAGRLIGEYLDNPDGTYGYVDYVWLNETPLVQAERAFSSGGVLLGTKTSWLHVDHLNTPRVATDDAKRVVWRWDSDPFGVGDADTDPDGDSVEHVVLLRFPGQYFDHETGLHYNYFRDYDPSTGRYLQSDPIGLSGGLNPYGYADSNPVNLIDPNGLVAIGAAVGGGIRFVAGKTVARSAGAKLSNVLGPTLGPAAACALLFEQCSAVFSDGDNVVPFPGQNSASTEADQCDVDGGDPCCSHFDFLGRTSYPSRSLVQSMILHLRGCGENSIGHWLSLDRIVRILLGAYRHYENRGGKVKYS
jgi:RHS repeat-associated protein